MLPGESALAAQRRWASSSSETETDGASGMYQRPASSAVAPSSARMDAPFDPPSEGLTRAFITDTTTTMTNGADSSRNANTHAVQRRATTTNGSALSPTFAAAATVSASAAAAAAAAESPIRFRYSWRLCIAMAPALLVILIVGGRPLATVLSVCTICAYVLDQLGSSEASFVASWMGVVAGAASLAAANRLHAAVTELRDTTVIVMMNMILCLGGLLLSCHYSFLARDLLASRGPTSMWGGAERLLFGALFAPIVAVETLAVFSMGATVAPFALCGVLTLNYALLVRPLPSSQQLCEHDTRLLQETPSTRIKRVGPTAASKPRVADVVSIPLEEMDLVLSPLLAGLYTLLFLALPYVLHLAIHRHVLLQHLISDESMMLVAMQFTALAVINRDAFLWFTNFPASFRTLLHRIVLSFSAVSLVVLVAHRVLVPVLGHRLVLQARWPVVGFVLLSVGLLTGLAAIVIAVIGFERRSGGDGERAVSGARVTAFQALLHLSALCLGVCLGFPLWALALLLLGAAAAARVLLARSALAFGLGAALFSLGMRVVLHHLLGFLDFELRDAGRPRGTAASVDAIHAHATHGLSFSSQVSVIWLQATLAVMLPLSHLLVGRLRLSSTADLDSSSPFGFLSAPRLRRTFGLLLDLLLALYVFVLASLEWEWVRLDSRGAFDSSVYPWYLVLLTSSLIVGLAHQLSPRRLDRISSRAYVMLVTLAVWKVCVLVAKDARDLYMLLAIVAAQAPMYLAYDRPEPTQATVANRMRPTAASARRGSGMTPRQGCLHLALVFVSMWVGRTVLARLWLSTGLASTTPNESTLVGLFLIGTTLGIAPLPLTHFRFDTRVRRAAAFALALAVAWIAIQPRLDFLLAPPDEDAMEGFTRGFQRVEARWPAWLLFGGVAMALATFAAAIGSTGGGAGTATTTFLPRPLLALGMGSSIGGYLVGTFLPLHVGLFTLMILAFNLAAIVVVYLFVGGPRRTSAPAASGAATSGDSHNENGEGGIWDFITCRAVSSTRIVSVAYCALLALLPVTYVAVGLAYSAPRMHNASSSSHRSSIADAALLYRCAVLGIHGVLHFLVALGVGLHRDLAASRHNRTQQQGHLYRVGFGVATGANDARPVTDAALTFVGNAATICAWVSGVVLIHGLFDASILGLLVLAPILLMMHRDQAALAELTHERRWWPVVAGTCLVLISSALFELVLRSPLASFGLASLPLSSRSVVLGLTSWFVVKNLLLLLLTVPSLHATHRHMWSCARDRRPGSRAPRTDTFTIVLMAPLDLLPLCLAELATIQLLAAIALVGVIAAAVARYTEDRRARRII